MIEHRQGSHRMTSRDRMMGTDRMVKMMGIDRMARMIKHR